MRNFKKITASVLTATLILSALPFAVFADEVPESETETNVAEEAEFVEEGNEGLEASSEEVAEESDEELAEESAEEIAEASAEAVVSEESEELEESEESEESEASSESTGFALGAAPLGSEPTQTIKEIDLTIDFDTFDASFNTSSTFEKAHLAIKNGNVITEDYDTYYVDMTNTHLTCMSGIAFADDLISKDKNYAVIVWVEAKEGYRLTDQRGELEVYVNDLECEFLAETEYSESSNSWGIYIPLSLRTYDINLSFDTSVFVDAMRTDVKEKDADLMILDAVSLVDSTECELDPNSTGLAYVNEPDVDRPIWARYFDEDYITLDRTYVLIVYVEAKDGYTFTDDIDKLNMYINGVKYTPSLHYSYNAFCDGWGIYIPLSDLREISEIDINVESGAIGTAFGAINTEQRAEEILLDSMSVDNGSTYKIDKDFSGLYYLDSATGEPVRANGSSFVSDKDYVMKLCVEANSSMFFTDDIEELKFFVNCSERAMLDLSQYDEETGIWTIYFNLSDYYLTEVDLTIDRSQILAVYDSEHVEGELWGELESNIDDDYDNYLASVNCLYYKDASSGELVDTGFMDPINTEKEYYAEIMVIENINYDFAVSVDEMEFRINGVPCVVDSKSFYNDIFEGWILYVPLSELLVTRDITLEFYEDVYDEEFTTGNTEVAAEAELKNIFVSDSDEYYVDSNGMCLYYENEAGDALVNVLYGDYITTTKTYIASFWVYADSTTIFTDKINELQLIVNGEKCTLLEGTEFDPNRNAWKVFIVLPEPTVTLGVEGFVNRCYTQILGREPETAGLVNWMNSLNNGTNCGAQVAYGFVFSEEYKNMNKSNEEFVTDLYTMFFGREPDAAGLRNWLNQLEAGVMDREQLFAAFAKSTEYKNICNEYGILQGCYIPGYSTASQTQVNLFVYRLYNACLGRNPDIGGLENWSRNILAGNTSGYSAALGFFTSTEYKNLNKSDEEFIRDLYLVMMDRPADASGLENWVKQLTVYSREEVIKMFCKSQEYRNICARYGINVGV